MNLFYKNFTAKIYFSPRTDTFFGEIQNLSELVAFQAHELADIQQAFQEAADLYLSTRKVELA